MFLTFELYEHPVELTVGWLPLLMATPEEFMMPAVSPVAWSPPHCARKASGRVAPAQLLLGVETSAEVLLTPYRVSTRVFTGKAFDTTPLGKPSVNNTIMFRAPGSLIALICW